MAKHLHVDYGLKRVWGKVNSIQSKNKNNIQIIELGQLSIQLNKQIEIIFKLYNWFYLDLKM